MNKWSSKMNFCVRCNKKYVLSNHPLAHFSSICQSCNEIKKETLEDQFKNELLKYKKFFYYIKWVL